jgi:hypothetical protein
MRTVLSAYHGDKSNSDEAAADLLNSPNMQPYLRLAMAGLQGSDIQPELRAIAEMPLEDRYIWRVASALRWAFADFDTVNVRADRDTLKVADLARVVDLLRLRPMQFCLFFQTLVGLSAMQQMMIDAMKASRDLADN